MKKKTVLLSIIVLCLLLSTVLFGVSRHTRAEAPVRFTTTIAEGEALTKTISCYDPDGDPVTITVEDLPAGASVGAQVTQPPGYSDPDLPAVPPDAPNAVWYTRELTWTPDAEQAGVATIYIHAVDDSGDDDWVKYEITVTNVNRPPVL